jgi:acyl carrier protein
MDESVRHRFYEQIRQYIVDERLGGHGEDFDEETPLLETGILDSFAMVDLVAHIGRAFGIQVPDDEVLPEHFSTLKGLIDLLVRIESEAAGPPQ